MLAAMPLLFATQQAIEGFIWLHPSNIILPYLYLIFAMVIWPTWIPFTFLSLGTPKDTHKIIQFLAYSGIILSCFMASILFIYGAHATIAGNHIHYTELYAGHKIIECITLWYLAPTIIPFFLMHNNYIALMGLFIFVSAIITFFGWHYHFGSLWCFCAAIISSLVPFILRARSIS